MNYQNIYNKFIEYFKHTKPKDRLCKRNKKDLRLNNEHLYVEKHHIIPRFLSGSDDPGNIIVLLPEEHLFIHKLRYKVFGYRQDMLAVRFCVNGLASKGYIKKCKNTSLELTKDIRSTYAWIKTNTNSFKKLHGWQTTDGKKRISNARVGKMPVKDAITGEIIGSVEVNHPNILNKKWVHITKGRKRSAEEKLKYPSQKGSNNCNFKSFATIEMLISFFVSHMNNFVVDDNVFAMKKFNEELKKYVKENFNKKIHADTIIKNRFGSVENYISQVNIINDLQIKYDPYYRSYEIKEKLKSASTKWRWITDGKENKRIKKDVEIPLNWTEGRTNVTY